GPSTESPGPPLPTPAVWSYLPEQREADQADRADDDAPPREQVESVAGDVVEEAFNHDPPGDERRDEADRHHQHVVEAHMRAVLVEVVGEGAGHGGHGEVE